MVVDNYYVRKDIRLLLIIRRLRIFDASVDFSFAPYTRQAGRGLHDVRAVSKRELPLAMASTAGACPKVDCSGRGCGVIVGTREPGGGLGVRRMAGEAVKGWWAAVIREGQRGEASAVASSVMGGRSWRLGRRRRRCGEEEKERYDVGRWSFDEDLTLQKFV